jgi:hypothetical protein
VQLANRKIMLHSDYGGMSGGLQCINLISFRSFMREPREGGRRQRSFSIDSDATDTGGLFEILRAT